MRLDDLADMAGVSKQFVSDVEYGKPTAQLGLALKLLSEVGLPLTLEIPDTAEPVLQTLRAKGAHQPSRCSTGLSHANIARLPEHPARRGARAFADHRATWPVVPMMIPLPGASTFSEVSRESVMGAAEASRTRKHAPTGNRARAVGQGVTPTANHAASGGARDAGAHGEVRHSCSNHPAW